MSPKRILISGYYGFDNAGDEAILRVLLTQLRTELGEISVTVVSGDPGHTRVLHQVNGVLWSDPLAIAQAVRDADLVVVGGGGLFHDYSGFLPDSLLTQGNFGLGFHVTAAVLASLFSKPLMLYAVGVGPLFSEHARRYTRAAAEAATRISVRDSASRDLLAAIGIPAERVEVTADPVFALAPAPVERARELLAASGVLDTAGLVGVSVRHWSYGVHPAFWQKEVAAGLDRYLDEHGGSLLFVPFQQIEGVEENDIAVAQTVRSHLRNRDRARILRGAHAPDELTAVLGQCQVVLGMRLHSLIFSAVAGVPFVGLGYDPKVQEIARQLGASESLLDLGGLTASSIAQRLAESCARGPVLDGSGRERLRGAAQQNASLLRAALDSGPAEMTPRLREMAGDAVLAVLEAQTRVQATEVQLREVLATTEARERHRIQELETQLEAERTAAHAKDADAEQNLALRDQQIDALSAVYRQRKQTLIELQTRAAQLEEHLAQARNLAAECAAQVDHTRVTRDAEAVDLRQKAAELERRTAQWRTFEEQYRRHLALERSQRGWRLMLVARKGYSMLVREGIGGKLRFPFWVLGLLVGRTGRLEEYEVHFPAPPPSN